ncbi:hypothetical protein JK358_34305 [Nocardia sp. 2]|uniref:Uncharacterized protein n=1 Tax=Nocardia acididurans TaxID=2802282 RepID=A0ABS1MGV3_9NOCA|nr:hypothetical protein [Nocardia acididurans]MBL1079491.1 hypothetical protein [Nocardia acididurans]
MHHNTIRATGIGVTAGVVAGIVTVAGIIACDDYGALDKLSRAVARRGLSPAQRWELDQLTAQKAEQQAQRISAREQQAAAVRAMFDPDLLPYNSDATTVEELTVEELVRGFGLVHRYCMSGRAARLWWDQRAALLSEFDRRSVWSIKHRLSLLDQTRLEVADAEIQRQRHEFAPVAASTAAADTGDALLCPPARPVGTRKYPPYPAFTGPDSDTADEAQTITNITTITEE